MEDQLYSNVDYYRRRYTNTANRAVIFCRLCVITSSDAYPSYTNYDDQMYCWTTRQLPYDFFESISGQIAHVRGLWG